MNLKLEVHRRNNSLGNINNYVLTPKCFKAILLKCTNNKKFL